MEKSGYIYILTNKSFPDWVKIGYADNIQQRLDQLNGSESTPFAFELYASYKVGGRLKDLNVHSLIDSINPNLRSIDYVNGKMRKREFYKMGKEQAYLILKNIAAINGMEGNLELAEREESVLPKEELGCNYASCNTLNSQVREVYDYFMDKLNEFSEVEIVNKKAFQGINHKDSRISNIIFYKSKFNLLLNSNMLSSLEGIKPLSDGYSWGQFNSYYEIHTKEDADSILKVLIDSYYIS